MLLLNLFCKRSLNPLELFLRTYKEYLTDEYPSRSDVFLQLSSAINHTKYKGGYYFTKDDMINILGTPDKILSNIPDNKKYDELLLYNFQKGGKYKEKGVLALYIKSNIYCGEGIGSDSIEQILQRSQNMSAGADEIQPSEKPVP